jgi:hypothetical protein
LWTAPAAATRRLLSRGARRGVARSSLATRGTWTRCVCVPNTHIHALMRKLAATHQHTGSDERTRAAQHRQRAGRAPDALCVRARVFDTRVCRVPRVKHAQKPGKGRVRFETLADMADELEAVKRKQASGRVRT